MVWSQKNPHLAEALNEDEAFLDLLKRDSRSILDGFFDDESLKEDSPHPDEQELSDYALGLLDKKQMGEVMDHLAVCRRCARDAMGSSRESEEMVEDLLEWAGRKPSE